MKKNMALMLAGAMAVTSIPVNVFADDATFSVATPATLNSNSNRSKSILVDTTTSGALGYNGLSYADKNGANDAGFDVVASPIVAVKGVTAPAGSQIEISLSSTEGSFAWGDKFSEDNAGMTFDEALTAAIGVSGVEAAKSPINSSTIVLTFTTALDNQDIKVPVNGVVSSNKAPLTASVKPLDNDSNVVFKTTTVATVKDSAQTGDTTTTVSDAFGGKNNLEFDLLVSENYAGTFGTGDYEGVDGVEVVTYTLSSGFEFAPEIRNSTGDINGLGDIEVVTDYGLDVTAEVINNDNASNKLTVKYTFDPADLTTQASSVKIKNIPVVAKSSTDYGTTAYLSGKAANGSSFANFSSVVAGNYTDYNFSADLFEGEEVATLPAGSLAINIVEGSVSSGSAIESDKDLFGDADAIDYIDEDLLEDYHETAALHVSEEIAGSLIDGRTITFTLPEEVQILGFKISNTTDIDTDEVPTGDVQYFVDSVSGTTGSGYKFDDNVLKLSNFDGVNDTDEASFNITFYVAADANYTGDVDVEVSGDALGGIELDPVTVATFAPAFDVTAKVNNVKAGVQATNTSDIVIKETEVGQFKDGETVYVKIDTQDTATLVNAITIADADVAVTAGDISIKNIDVEDDYLSFEVDGESSEPSEITISNVVISTAYGLPETSKYPFNVVINTDADENYALTNTAQNSSVKYGSLATPYVNITGDANALNGAEVAVTEGSTTYTVNGEEKEMDVAPYIDSASNSMMVPIRFIAEGVGLTEESGNLIWSANNKTVILRNGTDVIEFPVGANFYRLNGAVVYNDNNAVTQIVDGRTFVPFRTVGNALKLPVSWDADTRTATYN